MPTLTDKIDSPEWTTGDRPSGTLHYLLPADVEDATGKAIVKKPTAAYIEKV